MTSNSSKALPFVALIGGIGLVILSAAGYDEQVEHSLAIIAPILGLTAAGGLINKTIETYRALKETGKVEAAAKEIRERIPAP